MSQCLYVHGICSLTLSIPLFILDIATTTTATYVFFIMRFVLWLTAVLVVASGSNMLVENTIQKN